MLVRFRWFLAGALFGVAGARRLSRRLRSALPGSAKVADLQDAWRVGRDAMRQREVDLRRWAGLEAPGGGRERSGRALRVLRAGEGAGADQDAPGGGKQVFRLAQRARSSSGHGARFSAQMASPGASPRWRGPTGERSTENEEG